MEAKVEVSFHLIKPSLFFSKGEEPVGAGMG